MDNSTRLLLDVTSITLAALKAYPAMQKAGQDALEVLEKALNEGREPTAAEHRKVTEYIAAANKVIQEQQTEIEK